MQAFQSIPAADDVSNPLVTSFIEEDDFLVVGNRSKRKSSPILNIAGKEDDILSMIRTEVDHSQFCVDISDVFLEQQGKQHIAPQKPPLP